VDLTEEQLKKLLNVKNEKTPPCLKVLMSDGMFKLAYVVAEGKVIHGQTKSVLDALILVLAVYYVFDLQYPAIYGQLLGFLQQQVLEQPYTFFKGTNFQTFLARVKATSNQL
jgi:hypothetical protein